MEETKIEVTSLELINRGALKALVDVQVGPVLIKYIRVVGREGQPLRINLPSIKKGSPDDWRWEPVVTIIAQQLKREIESVILEEYRRKKAMSNG